MTLAEWRGAAIRYPFASENAVGPVDLAIGPGERVLLLGPSGSGKSSLMLALTGLIPQTIPATVSGDIRLMGQAVDTRSAAQWADTVAQYFQNADETLCGMRVGDEIAFALENRGVAPDAIEARIGDVLGQLGLPAEWRTRRSASMSGGERQLVALAAVMAQGAPVLVADEPTSHLSPEAAARVHGLLKRGDLLDGVLVIDHRLDGLIDAIDRVVVLGRDGRVMAEGAAGAVFRNHGAELDAAGIWRPAFSVLDAMLRGIGLGPDAPPLSFADILAALDPAISPPAAIAAARVVVSRFLARRIGMPVRGCETVAALKGADCAPPMGRVVLENVDIAVRAGEVVGLVGPNGAGKTTLAASLAGVLRLRKGTREGRPGGIAFQNPEAQLIGASVRDEIARAAGDERAADAVLERWGFAELADRHPFELSFGQKRRLALAALDAADRWPLIVLDEPFAGLDAWGAELLARHVGDLRERGKAVVLITHDMDMAVRLCDRLVVAAEGGICGEGAPLELLRDAGLTRRAGLAQPSFGPLLDWLDATADRALAAAG